MSAFLDALFGLHVSVQDLTWAQLSARTVVVFLVGLILVRVADRRFLGRNAGFDVLLAFVLGSVLSRGINGQAPFFHSLGAATLLVLLHRLVGFAASRCPPFSHLLKGQAIVLVKDGQPQREAMQAAHISPDDLEENLRLNANLADPAQIAEARLERSGEISAVKRKA